MVANIKKKLLMSSKKTFLDSCSHDFTNVEDYGWDIIYNYSNAPTKVNMSYDVPNGYMEVSHSNASWDYTRGVINNAIRSIGNANKKTVIKYEAIVNGSSSEFTPTQDVSLLSFVETPNTSAINRNGVGAILKQKDRTSNCYVSIQKDGVDISNILTFPKGSWITIECEVNPTTNTVSGRAWISSDTRPVEYNLIQSSTVEIKSEVDMICLSLGSTCYRGRLGSNSGYAYIKNIEITSGGI